MKLGKVIGWSIIASPFAVLFGVAIDVMGLKEALTGAFAMFGVLVFLGIGAYLATEGEE